MHIQSTFHQGQVEGGRRQVLLDVFREKYWTVGVPCVQLDGSGVGVRILTGPVRIKLLFGIRHQVPRVLGSIFLCHALKENDIIQTCHLFWAHLSISWLSENILSGETARWRTSSWFVQSTWAFKLTNNEDQGQKAPKKLSYKWLLKHRSFNLYASERVPPVLTQPHLLHTSKIHLWQAGPWRSLWLLF